MNKNFFTKIIWINLALMLSFCSCNSSKETTSIVSEKIPILQEVDKKFANVFKSLDGTWKGEFTIYEDPNPVNVSEVNLEKLTIQQVQRPELKILNTIQVKQVYVSESPYFQRVVITDTYPKTGKVDVSKGINKIEDGKMWCIVNKPDDKVIHNGKTDGDKTIIWYQNQQIPLKKEYFQETVDELFYEIIGYGYYNNDDVNLSPKLWFYGKYERQ
jgi:hypothetical protein